MQCDIFFFFFFFNIWPVHCSVTLSHNNVPHWVKLDQSLPCPRSRVNKRLCIVSDPDSSIYPRLDESKGRQRMRRPKRWANIREIRWEMSSIQSKGGQKKEKNRWHQWRRDVERQAAALTRSVVCHYILGEVKKRVSAWISLPFPCFQPVATRLFTAERNQDQRQSSVVGFAEETPLHHPCRTPRVCSDMC